VGSLLLVPSQTPSSLPLRGGGIKRGQAQDERRRNYSKISILKIRPLAMKKLDIVLRKQS
jgi:hypothetical protein